MSNFDFNVFASMHNLSLIAEAEKLINNFIGNGEGDVYIKNPDGTCVKLQKGVELIAIDYR